MADGKTTITFSFGGISFFLTIIFVILRVAGAIDWAWYWLISPLWISALIGISLFVVPLVICGILALIVLIVELVKK